VAEVSVPEVNAEPVVHVTEQAHVASAPMTRAPAPEYVPEAPRQSDWVRPSLTSKVKVPLVVTVLRTRPQLLQPAHSLLNKQR
jgi:hypothetical protein